MTQTTYLQPREGVSGLDRTDDPMLTSTVVKDKIALLMRHLFRAFLANQSTDDDRARAKRLMHPQPGDLVVVQDSIFSKDPTTRFEGVGYLLTQRDEWASTDAEWATMQVLESMAEADRVVFHDVLYVQYGPNAEDVCRWTNANAWAVPDSI
jgi:hypothetical protein